LVCELCPIIPISAPFGKRIYAPRAANFLATGRAMALLGAVQTQGGDMRIGLYPGTFDPITLGHTDIIQRAMQLVDRLVIGVAINRDKGPLFSLEQRVAMVQAECAQIIARTGGEIVVHPFENLLIDCARDVGAGVIIRGLRAVADFEYEFQMVGMNRAMDASVETVFLMADARRQAIASKLVKEIARLGGDIAPFVPAAVAQALTQRFAQG
jgi:pantetheine-phosphate adenylyltransferase